jgi:hypothetical protein
MMRAGIRRAIIVHAFKDRIELLDAEAIAIRRAVIERLFDKKTRDALGVVQAAIPDLFGNGFVSVNAGGPCIDIQLVSTFDGSGRSFPAEEAALPAKNWDKRYRLDLEGEDDLAKRAVAYGEATQALEKQRYTMSQTVWDTLKKFKTVAQLKSQWPEAMPLAQPIIDAHAPAPKAQLPAVQFSALNAQLGLPPSNDTLELTEVAA